MRRKRGVRRGFGFDIESPYSAPRGRRFSRILLRTHRVDGRLALDRSRIGAFLVLLTNAIHPDGHKDLKAFRAEAATLAAEGLGIRS